LLPAGSSWADAKEAKLRFFLSKEVITGIRSGSRISKFSNAVHLRRIRPQKITGGEERASLLDTFLAVATYRPRFETRVPPCAGTEVHRHFFLCVKPIRNRYAFLSAISIANILCAVLREAGVDTSMFSAHAFRGESFSTLAAMGFKVEELFVRARHSSKEILLRSYIRPADPRYSVLLSKNVPSRFYMEEALRL
jgi:hypothetical protein